MPTKLTYPEFIQSFTPFYINQELDDSVIHEIDKVVANYKDLIHTLASEEGLEKFIHDHDDSISVILSLVDLSGEKFKRIVTAIRMAENEIVTSEWDIDRIRTEILRDTKFKVLILDMFLNGNLSILAKQIPRYYLECSNLNQDTVQKLSDEFFLKRMLKKVGDGKYNNRLGDLVENEIEEKLLELNAVYGITYSREQFVPWIKRNMDFCIPNANDPYIIIESSYQVTTGSGQTTKREVEVETSSTIRGHNIQNGKNIAFVNLCDGAGWIGRQADLKKIHQCSDYVITRKTLFLLEDIILSHLPKKYLKQI